MIFIEFQKYYYVFDSNSIFLSLIVTFTTLRKSALKMTTLFRRLPNVVQINVEIDNIYSTLFNVVSSTLDLHNVVLTLIWRCVTSPRHINLGTTDRGSRLRLLLFSMFLCDLFFIMKETNFVSYADDNTHYMQKQSPRGFL